MSGGPRRGGAARWGLARRVVPAAAAALLPLPLLAAPAAAQGGPIREPAAWIEARLRFDSLVVEDIRDTRFEGDRTSAALLRFPDGERMRVKWAAAPRGGEAFNNHPRYEVAAFEIQKLFLEEEEYVVPPTVARCFPPDWVRELRLGAEPTFQEMPVVLVVLQYWLWSVRTWDGLDRARLREDTIYARRVGNLNLLTYLIRHSDANPANFVASIDPLPFDVFSVDNGLSFRAEESDRGTEWRELRVDRLPRNSVDRLRRLERRDLERALGVLAEFRIQGGTVRAVEPGPNLDPGRGIRLSPGVIQLGLTEREIGDVERRLRQLLRRVEGGRISLF